MDMTSTAIKQDLDTAFTNENTLTIFCYDKYPIVYGSFRGSSHRLKKIGFLAAYCQRKGITDILVTQLRQLTPISSMQRASIDISNSRKYLDIISGETRLKLTLDGDLADFTPEIRVHIKALLTAGLHLSVEMLGDMGATVGSVIWQIKLPKAAASRFLNAIDAGDPLLAHIGIQNIEVALTLTQQYAIVRNWMKLNRPSLAGFQLGAAYAESGAVGSPGTDTIKQHRVDLREVYLQEADLRGANLQGVNLDKANLYKANLQAANLREADLRETNLSGANLHMVNLQEANLYKANLNRANLSGADLYKANLSEGDMRGAVLLGANLNEANLQRGKLYEAKLQAINLQKADLRKADLSGTDLSSAILNKANLNEADLQGAKLQGTKLQGGKLGGVKLQGANLQKADLQDADLQNANLSGADLSSANLYQANLNGTTLRGIIYNKDTIWPHNFTFGESTAIDSNSTTVQFSQRASLINIVKTDYTTGAGIIFLIVFWVFYISLAYLGFTPFDFLARLRGMEAPLTDEAPFFLTMAIIGSMIVIPIIIWRVVVIQHVFASGVEVAGHIVHTWLIRGRGRIEYVYDYEGQTYRRGNAVSKNRRTVSLKLGNEVTIVVDPANPKRAFIQELYA